MFQFEFRGRPFKLQRYPQTTNRSLVPVSAAQAYLLRLLEEGELPLTDQPLVYNDRFGAWALALSGWKPQLVPNYASQKKAWTKNFLLNGLDLDQLNYCLPLEQAKACSQALMLVPKSMDLFELQLQQAHQALKEDGSIHAAFMTRHFTPSMLQIAQKYFEQVEQSRAWKKARILSMRGKKSLAGQALMRSIYYESDSYQQYYGVFSARQVDKGSRFFIENWLVQEEEGQLLDLACGNGILAHQYLKRAPNMQAQLTDDAYLAIASSQLNLPEASAVWTDELSHIPAESLDLVLSNPPFHFGHENNIEVSLGLFQAVKPLLKPNGSMQIVANRHLNYSSQLERVYARVDCLAQNLAFEVLRVEL
ncbi:class I SAM-dependent methyltransferase [Saprospira grandis]|uniref:class I SAM-dependent methyltransferase n=1 Tax=Saprospira grandis TaxID=1008 RepID=UPI0022DE8B80|nr:methyltransferase [Saprospira grandis]WBM74490.1 methyltransferase [Saprospira grandis]